MENNEREEKEPRNNKVAAFFKRVFVHNIGWKLLALVSSALIWTLSAGLF